MVHDAFIQQPVSLLEEPMTISQAVPRLMFLHGMDTYAEFQVSSLNYQAWTHSSECEWVTISAPNQGADFSSGAGGLFLRE